MTDHGNQVNDEQDKSIAEPKGNLPPAQRSSRQEGVGVIHPTHGEPQVPSGPLRSSLGYLEKEVERGE